MLLVSDSLNSILKVIFHTARPFWYSRRVTAYAFEDSFGLPSGHAQNSAAVFGLLAASLKRNWVWAISLTLIFLIGLSRIYLAVHFPQDVIAGWIVGFLLVWIFLRLEKPVIAWLSRHDLGVRLLSALASSLALLFLGVLVRFILRDWQLPTLWVENARVAFPSEETINPLKISGLVTSTGVLFGISAGALWLSERGGFDVKGNWGKRILRFLVGVFGVLVLWLGLSGIIPDEASFWAYTMRYIQYAMIGFWISALAPLIFLRLKIAEPVK